MAGEGLLNIRKEKYMLVFHDSHDLEYRKPFGAVAEGSAVRLRIKIKREGKKEVVEQVFARLWVDNEREELHEMQFRSTSRGVDTYEVKITTEKPMLLWYFFVIKSGEETRYFGENGELSYEHPPSYQITVYKKDYQTPKWFHKGVAYQIFVDRFYSGKKKTEVNVKQREDYQIHEDWNEPVATNVEHNDFYGGDLQGVIEKLDYLEDLGVSVLYLNPIFEAYSNHKYDTGDYMKIDPMFGDEKVFKELCKQAKRRGMSVILDGVFNHTGSDSRYFNREGNYDSVGAYQSEDSPYHSWYRFDEFPDKYECWWGIDTLPHTNEEDESYKDFILRDEDSVVKHWLKCGARGWRLDVVDELPTHFVQDLRTAVKEVSKDAVIIGEVWEDASNKVAYSVLREYFLGDELDGVLNYPFKRAINGFLTSEIDAGVMGAVVKTIVSNYPSQSLRSCMNLVGGHDTVRVKTLYGGNQDLVKMAALWQMTFLGVPLIYYGDEVGMEGEADPYNRGPFPWNNADLELHNWYKKLIGIRNEREVLQIGEFAQVYAEGDVYAYVRHGKGAAVLVILNRGAEAAEVVLDLYAWGGKRKQKFTIDSMSGMVYDVVNGEVVV